MKDPEEVKVEKRKEGVKEVEVGTDLAGIGEAAAGTEAVLTPAEGKIEAEVENLDVAEIKVAKVDVVRNVKIVVQGLPDRISLEEPLKTVKAEVEALSDPSFLQKPLSSL